MSNEIELISYSSLATILGVGTVTIGRRAKRLGYQPERHGREHFLPLSVLQDVRFCAR